MHDLARRKRCIDCGRPLGSAAIELGQKRWREILDGMFVELNAVRISVDRWLHAVCTHCGCAYQYLESENRFQKVEVSEPSEGAAG